jgi:uncharacterized phage protein gp47/JayE
MPYARPTLTALRNTAIQDITTSGVPGLDGLLRNSVLRVLAWCIAGLTYSLYGFLDWISREAVPFTATDEYLQAWAALIGVYQLDATAASGVAQFTGVPNIAIPLGATLTRQDGTPYVSTADAGTDSTGVALVSIVAAITGAITNCDGGTPISLDMPPPGVNAGGMTVGLMRGGSDQETEDAFRTRMLRQYAAPPHGGSANDYIEWATSVPGCTRAWTVPEGQGPGTVEVFVMFDIANAATGGFPIGTDGAASLETRAPTATGDQLLVADAIWPLEPVTALVYVMAPIALPVAVTLSNLSPNTIEQQTDILASLHDMFLNISEVGGTIYPSDIYAAIINTPGVVHFEVITPTAPVIAPARHLPVMGTLTSLS